MNAVPSVMEMTIGLMIMQHLWLLKTFMEGEHGVDGKKNLSSGI
ncbi:hypothetical protein BMS3Abin04_02565 [bacterium BMS3Abin04]|nr:hypothetical protein BMS3Abin04_02565 [bacterium BMS3Abin04]